MFVVFYNLCYIQWYGDRCLRCYVLLIEELFKRNFEVLNSCICIDEYYKFVGFEELCQSMWFYLCIMYIFQFCGIEEVVVVVMNLCLEILILCNKYVYGNICDYGMLLLFRNYEFIVQEVVQEVCVCC